MDERERPARADRGLLTIRPTRSALLAGVLLLLLGVGLSAQIHHTRDRGLESLRESELISILDSVTARSDRLDEEIRALEREREALAQGTTGGAEAIERARRRSEDLGILAGTVPANGPGVTITLHGSGDMLGANVLLDLVQELRDAGAEAIQVGDVRVVASTAFTDATGVLTVGGRPVNRPVRVVAIGDAQTLASALAIPGGVADNVRGRGADLQVTSADRVLVNALHAPSAPRYARPVGTPTGSASP